MYDSDDKILFWEKDGHSVRAARVQGAVGKVDMIPAERVLNEDPSSIIAEISAQHAAKIPTLNTDNITFKRSQKRQSGHDAWGERHDRTIDVIIFEVPFEGDQSLFETKPGKWTTNPPRAAFGYNKSLSITVRDTGDAATMKAELDATLHDIEEYLGWHREFWKDLAEEVSREAGPRLAARRAKLAQAKEADGGLAGFGFKPKT